MAKVELYGELRELARGAPGPFVHLPMALQRLMTTRGLTQAALAQTSGVSQSRISSYVSGRRTPAIATLGKLLEAMGATVRELAEEMER